MSSATDGGPPPIQSREEETDPNWYVECSDEEVYKSTAGCSKKGSLKWNLSSRDALRFYGQMESHPEGVVPIRWQCPGRRPPTPSDEEYTSEGDDEEENSEAAPPNPGVDKSMDFDFAEDTPASSLTPRRPISGENRELKGSARKKTTNFNNVIANMNRYRQIDAANRAAAGNSTPSSSSKQS